MGGCTCGAAEREEETEDRRWWSLFMLAFIAGGLLLEL